MADLTILVAFAAGLASFLSPCVLPLMPAFLAYIAGTTLDREAVERRTLFLHTVAFVLGFGLVFALLGVVLNVSLQTLDLPIQGWLSRVAGAIIIMFGLHLSGVIEIGFLNRELDVGPKQVDAGYLTAMLFGASFAVGWTPCVGPILGSTFALAASQPASAFGILLAYAAGLGVPFLLIGLFPFRAISLIQGSGRRLELVTQVFGAILIVIGVLVFTEQLSTIAMLAPVEAVAGVVP